MRLYLNTVVGIDEITQMVDGITFGQGSGIIKPGIEGWRLLQAGTSVAAQMLRGQPASHNPEGNHIR
jgi:hypothetical protein